MTFYNVIGESDKFGHKHKSFRESSSKVSSRRFLNRVDGEVGKHPSDSCSYNKVMKRFEPLPINPDPEIPRLEVSH